MTLFLHRRRRGSSGNDEDGYVLMILLLTVALIIIFAAAIVPTIKFEMEHDREEEMIHRGVQYSRAIRAYYKKFGRYPVKLEDLESANNLRFLRKRYKDPTNCKAGECQDFKLLHFGEVKLTFGGGVMPGMVNPGAAGAAGGLANNGLALSAGIAAASSFGQTQQANPFAATDPSQSSQPASGSTDQNSADGSKSDSGSGDSASPNLKGFSNQTFGGGPIVGVASTNKKEGYREFNHKKKYSEWQFIYDPGTDRGGLLMTPNQPPLVQQPQNVNGQNNGQNNSGTSGTNPTGFGIQNNSNQSPNGQTGTAPDPNNPPPPQ